MQMKKTSLVAVGSLAGLVLGASFAGAAAASDHTYPTRPPMTSGPGTSPTGSDDSDHVVGEELVKVTAAVTTAFPGTTVVEVEKEDDGRYEVKALKADGTRVCYYVSADLATVTERTAIPSRPEGPRPGHAGEDTPVIGDEAAKVTAAVVAAYPGVTVVEIEKDDDGSYDVRATRADGTRVTYDVSADLATITEHSSGPRGPRPPLTPPTPPTQPAPAASSAATPTSVPAAPVGTAGVPQAAPAAHPAAGAAAASATANKVGKSGQKSIKKHKGKKVKDRETRR